jgi:hypothetical protein
LLKENIESMKLEINQNYDNLVEVSFL